MSQQESNDSGFALPLPADGSGAQAFGEVAVAQGAPGVDTSSRDLLVGGGVLLVLLVAFFFAKNAYANALVSRRVSPNRANAAAWWLFVFLASLSTAALLSIVDASRFMTPLVLGPLAAMGLAGLVLALAMGRR
ncbi:hypothetical protein [Comamonas endophytica]|uniref:Uncharacterized protein n=1 Tax=Comamonas endophytica TaxID=2949090 RepID=A0ABY6G981_9BURK|nr:MULTISPECIES: hypothetical protein [unclassified Acidovorax]MCD2511877.1 hypothetical protein [Acidovorax sp. D4N7]UYG51597.1 hypothetical protein M9799_16340 [Acidovorax sp. 5MLIR]